MEFRAAIHVVYSCHRGSVQNADEQLQFGLYINVRTTIKISILTHSNEYEVAHFHTEQLENNGNKE